MRVVEAKSCFPANCNVHIEELGSKCTDLAAHIEMIAIGSPQYFAMVSIPLVKPLI